MLKCCEKLNFISLLFDEGNIKDWYFQLRSVKNKYLEYLKITFRSFENKILNIENMKCFNWRPNRDMKINFEERVCSDENKTFVIKILSWIVVHPNSRTSSVTLKCMYSPFFRSDYMFFFYSQTKNIDGNCFFNSPWYLWTNLIAKSEKQLKSSLKQSQWWFKRPKCGATFIIKWI